MSKLYQLLITLFIATLVFSSLSSVSAAENDWTEIPPSDTYLDYLKNPDEYKIIPPYYDAITADKQSESIEKGVSEASTRITLPSSYDVRNDGGIPVIKDQGADSTCSIFAVLGNYEILTSLNGTLNVFSEYHAKHAITRYFSDGPNPYGYDRAPSEGLHPRYMMGYLMNGKGPIPSTFSGYLLGDKFVTSSYINSVTPTLQTQEIQVLPGLGDSATDSEIEEWITELKSLVYEYGSVAITMSSSSYYSDTSDTYFYCSTMPTYHDHAVVCIGWDDSIPAEKFTNLYGKTPSRDGGFIFRNSWGTSWGDDGYGYLSYDSLGIAMQDFQVVSAYREREDGEEIHSYAELGVNGLIGAKSSQCQWFGNKFYLDKYEFVNLKEVSFYAPISGISYDVYVSTTGSTNRNDFTYVDTVTPEYPGFFSVATDFDLGSSDYSEYLVMVKSNCRTNYYSVPVEGVADSFSNICNEYITYFDENGKRVIIPYSEENEATLNESNIDWSMLDTGYVARDNNPLSSYSLSNIGVNAITVPIDFYVSASAQISATQATVGDEIAVTTSVLGDGSGNYSYSYKLYFDGEVIEEYTGDSSYSFIAENVGEYYVEVTVLDVDYNITAVATTDILTVETDQFAVRLAITAVDDGNYSITGNVINAETDGITYFTYVLKDGVIVSKSVYAAEIDASFNADEAGSYTVIVYAQDKNKLRVSARETFTV